MKIKRFLSEIVHEQYKGINTDDVKLLTMQKIADGRFATIVEGVTINHTEPIECDFGWNSKYDSKEDTTYFSKKDKLRENGIVVVYSENCEKEGIAQLVSDKQGTILALSLDKDIVIETRFPDLLSFKNSCTRYIESNEKYFSFICMHIEMFVGRNGEELILTKSMKSKLALNDYLTEPIGSHKDRYIYFQDGSTQDVEDYIKERFSYMAEHKISDLAMAVNAPAFYRIDKKLKKVDENVLNVKSMFNVEDFFLDQLKTEKQLREYREIGFTRVAYPYYGVGRFRITMGRQRNTPYLSARALPETIRDINDYHLSSLVKELLYNSKGGLVLICGEPNSGKSSLISSVIDTTLKKGGKKVLTIEDPIEQTFKHQNGMVLQLERGVDIRGFDDFARMIVTQDPDVIYITEIRDHNELDIAVNQSKLGKVVYASTHGNTVFESLTRMGIMIPKEERESKTKALYGCLKLVIVQQLIPRANGKGVVPLHEILVLDDSFRNNLMVENSTTLGNSLKNILTREDVGNKEIGNDAYNLWQTGLITEEAFLDRIGKTELTKNDRFQLYKSHNVIDISSYGGV